MGSVGKTSISEGGRFLRGCGRQRGRLLTNYLPAKDRENILPVPLEKKYRLKGSVPLGYRGVTFSGKPSFLRGGKEDCSERRGYGWAGKTSLESIWPGESRE